MRVSISTLILHFLTHLLFDLQYSGEYNLLIVTLCLICFDHYMERRVMKDLQRVVHISRTLANISDDIERKEKQAKVLSKI